MKKQKDIKSIKAWAVVEKHLGVLIFASPEKELIKIFENSVYLPSFHKIIKVKIII